MITLTAKNGSVVPPVGLGTFPLQDIELAGVIKSAVMAGYRLIDTSDDYEGEIGIGVAIQKLISENICKREDLFIQSKVSNHDSYYDEPLRAIYFADNSPFMKRHSIEDIVREKVLNSLTELQTNYLDSLLIHFPYEPCYIDIWKVLIKLKEEGFVRYIGVSNFHPKHIDMLYLATGVYPTMNEIYLSPIGSKDEQIKYANERNILLMTYSPLIDLTHNKFSTELLLPIAAKYNKSVAQIVLRWNIERGSIPLPKSSNLKRLNDNIDVFDFKLSKEEVDIITSLNRGYQYLPESLNCPGI